MRTPFTADEIRRNCPPGRTVVTRTDGPDGTRSWTTSRFVACDADGAEIVWESTLEDGSVTGHGTTGPTWEELRLHAAFPAERTTMDKETIATALGASDCLHYRVTSDEAVAEFWFAKDRPGMPILVVRTGTDGGVTRTEVVEDRLD